MSFSVTGIYAPIVRRCTSIEWPIKMTDHPVAGQPVSPHAGPAPRKPSGDITTGIVLMIIFALIAPGIDIFAKLATQTIPPGEVALARFVVQFTALLPLILMARVIAQGHCDEPSACMRSAAC